MGVKGKICVVHLMLFVAVVLVSANVSVGKSERELEISNPITICKTKCAEIQTEDEGEKHGCKQKCEEYFPEEESKERQGGQGTRGGRGSGGDRYNIIYAEQQHEVQKMVEDCHQKCQGSQGEQLRPECFQQCMKTTIKEQGKQDKGSSRNHNNVQHHKQKTEKNDQESNNPYVFQDEHFTTRLETELGNTMVLQKFTDRSEDLFKGIEKYRVSFLEVKPQAFVVPIHWDADGLFFVINGDGVKNVINSNSRQSHNIKRGDIFRVPVGSNMYLINTHNSENLVVANLIRSVSVPGELQTFFSVGVDNNPESSFFNVFTTEVLEAAFNVDGESFYKLFSGQQQQEEQQGVFKKATKEQIRSLSGKDGIQIWPFGGKKDAPYNIFNNRPFVSNENGVLHVVDSDDLSDLRKMNAAFSLFNITPGSMVGPIYNARATVALVIVSGEGEFQMACPHLAEQSSSGSSGFTPSYEKVSAELQRGTVVVIPVGHPFVIVASNNQALEVIGFGLNTDENEWVPLAGRDNVMGQWEDEAMELTFGAPAREVKQVIGKQNKRFFFKGPVSNGRAFA